MLAIEIAATFVKPIYVSYFQSAQADFAKQPLVTSLLQIHLPKQKECGHEF